MPTLWPKRSWYHVSAPSSLWSTVPVDRSTTYADPEWVPRSSSRGAPTTARVPLTSTDVPRKSPDSPSAATIFAIGACATAGETEPPTITAVKAAKGTTSDRRVWIMLRIPEPGTERWNAGAHGIARSAHGRGGSVGGGD